MTKLNFPTFHIMINGHYTILKLKIALVSSLGTHPLGAATRSGRSFSLEHENHPAQSDEDAIKSGNSDHSRDN